jgi:hypothetical protein
VGTVSWLKLADQHKAARVDSNGKSTEADDLYSFILNNKQQQR